MSKVNQFNCHFLLIKFGSTAQSTKLSENQEDGIKEGSGNELREVAKLIGA